MCWKNVIRFVISKEVLLKIIFHNQKETMDMIIKNPDGTLEPDVNKCILANRE